MSSDTPSMVDLMSEAQRIVESKPTWRRFIDGTPLSNDIAVWMAEFARTHLAAKTAEVERLQFALEVAQKAQFKPDAALRERVEELEGLLLEVQDGREVSLDLFERIDHAVRKK